MQTASVVQFPKPAALSTDDAWTAYINEADSNPVLAIINRGRKLAERKAAIHSVKMAGFEDFCRDRLKIGKTMAYGLMEIGAWGQNRSPLVNDLPASWRTLYVLSRLPEALFDAALADGRITPEMTRAEAEALKPAPAKPTSPSRPAPTAQAPANTPAPTTAAPPPTPSQPATIATPPWEGPNTISQAGNVAAPTTPEPEDEPDTIIPATTAPPIRTPFSPKSVVLPVVVTSNYMSFEEYDGLDMNGMAKSVALYIKAEKIERDKVQKVIDLLTLALKSM